MEIARFWPIRNETNLRLLNLRFNIKDNMLCVLFSSHIFENERKPSKTPHTSLLMLDANNHNSWATIESSSIKSNKLSEILYSSLSFRLIVIITFKASKSNQCPRDRFNTQALTIEDKTSTII
jgi:hypothetical protein